MREHLFRGKRLSTAWPGEKAWVEGSLIDVGNHEQVMIFPPLDRASSLGVRDLVRIHAVPVDFETVGEWTGFLDHHGKKIFEGDIVFFKNEDGELSRYEILWQNAMWVTRYVEDPLCDLHDGLDSFFAERCEVCGNIHDNPELSEGAV